MLTAKRSPLLVLHPRYKLDYFKSAQWPKVWQKTAREMVEEEYASRYAPSESSEDEDAGLDDPSEGTGKVRAPHVDGSCLLLTTSLHRMGMSLISCPLWAGVAASSSKTSYSSTSTAPPSL